MIRLIALASCLLFAAPALADTTVYVVRHAEKVKKEGEKDPNLTAAGQARAKALAGALRSVPLAAIYTTKYKRNRQTVAPTEAQQSKKAVVYEAHDTDGLANRIVEQHRGKAVLVAGHSNTVPGMLKSLGVKTKLTLDEDDYDNLFVVRVDDAGRAHLVHLHFGVMTP